MQRSPLNYTGNKFKLLDQLLPLFPVNVGCFYDCFFGGGSVTANVPYQHIVGIELADKVVEVHQLTQKLSFTQLDTQICMIIQKYGLSCSALGVGVQKDYNIANAKGYYTMRDDYNKNPSPEQLLVLIIYGFNNNIRFNPKGEFNIPVGKRDYNKSIRGNLKGYIDRLATKRLTLLKGDFTLVEQLAVINDFVYTDPPYSITTAQYNTGWNTTDDVRLMGMLDRLNARGIKFAMSNVFSSGGKTNVGLMQWATKYKVVHLKHSYANSAYSKKNKTGADEVLIINY